MQTAADIRTRSEVLRHVKKAGEIPSVGAYSLLHDGTVELPRVEAFFRVFLKNIAKRSLPSLLMGRLNGESWFSRSLFDR
jgi:hypothetical protein